MDGDHYLESDESSVCCACAGNLGLWANGIIQLLASKILAEQQLLPLSVSQRWYARFGRFFIEDEWNLRVLSDAAALRRPIVADRVILSHPGFKAWLASQDPYRSLARGLGVEHLSGKQLRKRFPQITADHLNPSECASDTPPLPSLRGTSLWGYFQFHARAYAPHRHRIQSLLRLREEDAIKAKLDQERRGFRRLIAVHIRKGDFADLSLARSDAALSRPPAILRAEPPFEEGQGEAWDDPHCVAFRTPLSWVTDCLETDGDVGFQPAQDLLWICTDDSALARDPRLGRFQGRSWAVVDGNTSPDVDSMMILDWATLAMADVLLTSNSTFSFTAAWKGSAGEASHARRYLRPDARVQRFVPFDPWDSLILLPAAETLPGNHSIHLQPQQKNDL